MKVASMINSMIDFPGRPAVTLFLAGCDFRCPYCHNADIIAASAGRSWGAATEKELRGRAALASALVVSGGEPTLHGGKLADLLRLGRSLGLTTGLHTNGSRPDVLRGLVDEELLDWVGLDIKGGPTTYAKMAGSEEVFFKVMESTMVLRNAGIPLELRTTCHPDVTPPSEVIRALMAGGDPASHVLKPARVTEGVLAPLRDAAYREEDMAEFKETAMRMITLTKRMTTRCA